LLLVEVSGGVVVAVGIDVVVDGPVVPLVPTVELPKVIVSVLYVVGVVVTRTRSNILDRS